MLQYLKDKLVVNTGTSKIQNLENKNEKIHCNIYSDTGDSGRDFDFCGL